MQGCFRDGACACSRLCAFAFASRRGGTVHRHSHCGVVVTAVHQCTRSGSLRARRPCSCGDASGR